MEKSVKVQILVSRTQEKLPNQLWFENLGAFLDTNPNDNEFRGNLSKDNPNSLWNNRPKKLKVLDDIFQHLPHTESVGDHSYHVAMNLNTEKSYNHINYLYNNPELKKIIRTVAILHDVGKRRNTGDKKHPYNSAQEVEQYLKWMNFNDKEIKLCLHLIAHHDFLGKASNPRAKETIDDLIKICPKPAILQCLWAITIADVSSIKGLMKIPNILENITKMALAADYKLQKNEEKRAYSFPR